MIVPRVFLIIAVLGGGLELISASDSKPAFEFQQVDYFHRWSGGRQHEFTPAKQEDLEHWSDMITVNGYPDVDDGEKLAGAANAVLGNYRRAEGKIIRTSSVPASEDNPAQHFIAVAFTRPGFAEAAFARFKLVDGQGYSLVYSHRCYGGKASEEINTWLKANAEKTENALMKWDPSLDAISPD